MQQLEHFPTFAGTENGYPTAVRLLVCDHNDVIDMGQITLVKAISGNDRRYVISRARRVPSFDAASAAPPISQAEIGAWSQHLRLLTLCDTRNPAHPCPPNVGASNEEP